MEIALLIIVALILYTTFMMGYKKGIMKIILSVAITVVSFFSIVSFIVYNDYLTCLMLFLIDLRLQIYEIFFFSPRKYA